MPSPLVHFTVAVSAAIAARDGSPLRGRRAVGAALVASVLPDIDLLAAALLPGGIAWHHGPTHSLVGAGGLGFGLALLLGLRGAPLLWTTLAGLSHPLLDWELGTPGASSAFGVPLAWPISAAKSISPYPVFLPFKIHEPGFLANMFSREAVAPYLVELVFSATVLGYVRLTRGRFRWRPRGPPA